VCTIAVVLASCDTRFTIVQDGKLARGSERHFRSPGDDSARAEMAGSVVEVLRSAAERKSGYSPPELRGGGNEVADPKRGELLGRGRAARTLRRAALCIDAATASNVV
jgi:hypothetical protein